MVQPCLLGRQWGWPARDLRPRGRGSPPSSGAPRRPHGWHPGPQSNDVLWRRSIRSPTSQSRDFWSLRSGSLSAAPPPSRRVGESTAVSGTGQISPAAEARHQSSEASAAHLSGVDHLSLRRRRATDRVSHWAIQECATVPASSATPLVGLAISGKSTLADLCAPPRRPRAPRPRSDRPGRRPQVTRGGVPSVGDCSSRVPRPSRNPTDWCRRRVTSARTSPAPRRSVASPSRSPRPPAS